MEKNVLYHIKKVIEYLYYDEHKDFESSCRENQENHIFNSVKYLDSFFSNVEDIKSIAYTYLKRTDDRKQSK